MREFSFIHGNFQKFRHPANFTRPIGLHILKMQEQNIWQMPNFLPGADILPIRPKGKTVARQSLQKRLADVRDRFINGRANAGDILRYYWIDEAQHAKADSILINEIAGALTADQREAAMDELLELGMAIDGLLAQQTDLDVAVLEAATKRTLTEAERAEIVEAQRCSYRWTFIVSGLEHPKIMEVVDQLTNEGSGKITGAAEVLAA